MADLITSSSSSPSSYPVASICVKVKKGARRGQRGGGGEDHRPAAGCQSLKRSSLHPFPVHTRMDVVKRINPEVCSLPTIQGLKLIRPKAILRIIAFLILTYDFRSSQMNVASSASPTTLTSGRRSWTSMSHSCRWKPQFYIFKHPCSGQPFLFKVWSHPWPARPEGDGKVGQRDFGLHFWSLYSDKFYWYFWFHIYDAIFLFRCCRWHPSRFVHIR